MAQSWNLFISQSKRMSFFLHNGHIIVPQRVSFELLYVFI